MKTKLAKLAASIEADQTLDRILEKTNSGFTGGKITKNDLLSWIIQHFEKGNFERNIEKIREDHFDYIAHLDGLVKRVKTARHKGEIDRDAEEQLQKYTGKSSKTKLTPLSTNGRQKVSETA